MGDFPMPRPDEAGMIECHDVSASPSVAGMTGQVTWYTEKGFSIATLYFDTGDFTVKAVGFRDVGTSELVALGDALTGPH